MRTNLGYPDKILYLRLLFFVWDMIRNIGVFCSSYDNIGTVFFDEGAKLGEWIGKTGRRLVFGGTSHGLMEHIARAAKINGGKVSGVVPESLAKAGFTSSFSDETVTVASLSERKETIIRMSDVLIAMPGGFGTLDEAFTAIASRRLGYHSKEVVFCNTAGVFDDLDSLLKKLMKQRFAPDSYLNYYKIFPSVEHCIEYLENK